MHIFDQLFGIPVDGSAVQPNQPYTLVFDGCHWNMVGYTEICDECGGIGGCCVPSKELIINKFEPEVYGKKYLSFANADAYIVSQGGASESDPWNVRFSGEHSENIMCRQRVNYCGNGQDTSILSGRIDCLEPGRSFLPSNFISNCTIENLDMHRVFALIDYTPFQAIPYSPDTLEIKFHNEPTLGNYQIEIDTIYGNFTYTFNYNATALDIQTAIIASDPIFSAITVTGSYLAGTLQYIITMNNIPAGTTHISLLSDTTDGTVGVTGNHGDVEVQVIMLSQIPTAGSYRIQYVYNGIVYTTSYFLQYNQFPTSADIDNIYQQILIDWGIDLGIGYAQVQVGAFSGVSYIAIGMFGYPGQSSSLWTFDASTFSLMANRGKGIDFENCRLKGAMAHAYVDPVPLYMILGQPYVPDITYYVFTPDAGTSGTYSIDITTTIYGMPVPFPPIVVNWDDTAADIQLAIQSSNPLLSSVIVTGTGVPGSPFGIACYGLPAEGLTTISFTNINLDPGVTISQYISPVGNTQIIGFIYIAIPTAGSYVLNFSYNGVIYSSIPLMYNSNQAAIEAAFRAMLLACETANPGLFLGSDAAVVNIGGQGAIKFELKGCFGVFPSTLYITNNTLTYNARDGHWMRLSNGVMMAGDYSSFTGQMFGLGMFSIVSSTVSAGMDLSTIFTSPPLILGDDNYAHFDNCLINCGNPLAMPMRGATFRGCQLPMADMMDRGPGVYHLRGSSFEGVSGGIDIHNGTHLKAFSCFFRESVTGYTGSFLLTRGTVLEGGGDPHQGWINMGGTWENLGETYNPNQSFSPTNHPYAPSGLNSKDVQGAIDELAFMMGGGGGVISITYANLIIAMGAGTLVPGSQYLITDYQSKILVPDTQSITVGGFEPLLVTALSTTKIGVEAFSSGYPLDVIEYSYSDDDCGDIAHTPRPGIITYRRDTVLDNSTFYDFRVAKWRRYALDPTVHNTWNAGLTYGVGVAMISPGNNHLYYCYVPVTVPGTQPHLDPTHRINITDLSTNSRKFVFGASILSTPLTLLPLTYTDYYTFNPIDNKGNHLGFMSIDNIFWESCGNNEIGDRCQKNRFGKRSNGTYGVTMGLGSSRNFFESNFGMCIFQGQNIRANDTFYRNNFVGGSCIFEHDCSYNNIGSMGLCIVGNYFHHNDVGTFVNNCIFPNNCENNVIGSNINGVNFMAATHIVAPYSCNIFTRQGGVYRLSYVDVSDNINIVAANA